MKIIIVSFFLFVFSSLVYSQIYSDTFVNIQGATSSLTGIYTVPVGVNKIKVQCWGGGGAGGAATGQAAAGGGGSGGCYVDSVINVVPGQQFNYSVGNGGNGGTVTNGSNTWFGSNTTLLAKGGLAGYSATLSFVTMPGASAVNSGNIGNGSSFYGGAGGSGTYGGNGSQAGGGGGAAGSNSNGSPGSGASGGLGGGLAGGSFGGSGATAGTWQLPLNCNCNGNHGNTPGGGGSGGQSSDPADNYGGHGGAGMIIISAIRPGIGGRIFKDVNGNCSLNSNETGMREITVCINPGNYVVETDQNGEWVLNNLPIGFYSAQIDTTQYPMILCDTTINFNVSDDAGFYSSSPIGIHNISCPVLDVSIFGGFQRCTTNNIFIAACNNFPSTIAFDSSYLVVNVDPAFQVNGANLPYTILSSGELRFETGTILPGECANVVINGFISCSVPFGYSVCNEATLYPIDGCVLDTIPSEPVNPGENTAPGGPLDGIPGPCALPWDHSSLTVEGWCQNDSAFFYVENHGSGDMACWAPVIVMIDGVVTYTDSILLLSGQGVTYAYPANGQTWILNAEQHPLHPGNSHPNAHVQSCGGDPIEGGGCVNDYRLDDEDPVVDIFCGIVPWPQPINGTPHDPNDKTGYPNGFSEQHYINPNHQLQYVIRFQNTGTDTAYNVVIRDTLDVDLNIFTVTPGVASHAYEFRMYGPRVLEWTISNIVLTDSTTNLEESNGFVTFHVDQLPNLIPGTIINNDADIYFDFELPVTTNETWHTIYNGFFAVAGVNELDVEGTTFKVYPNPVNGQLTIEAGKASNERYVVYDQMGKKILSGKLSFPMTTIDASSMNQGIYFIQIGENKSDTFKIVKL